jgi:hypothetical protein
MITGAMIVTALVSLDLISVYHKADLALPPTILTSVPPANHDEPVRSYSTDSHWADNTASSGNGTTTTTTTLPPANLGLKGELGIQFIPSSNNRA